MNQQQRQRKWGLRSWPHWEAVLEALLVARAGELGRLEADERGQWRRLAHAGGRRHDDVTVLVLPVNKAPGR